MGHNATKTKEYTVMARDISWAQVEFPEMTYTGKALTPKGKVVLDNKTLVYGKDYEINYEDNINYGYATANIKGIGAYKGERTAYFKIGPKDISEVVMPQIPDMEYTGNYIYPKFELKDGGKTLVYGTDYGFEVTNNLDVNTASIVIKGINNYTGTAKVSFDIIPRVLNSDTARVSCVSKLSYTKIIQESESLLSFFSFRPAFEPVPRPNLNFLRICFKFVDAGYAGFPIR